MKKSISPLFDSKKLNNIQNIFGGTCGSNGNPDQVDTGATANGTYDKETTTKTGSCDASNTGFVGGNGEQDNPDNPYCPPR